MQMLWGVSTFYQIFLPRQVKRSAFISNKVYTGCLTSCRTTYHLGRKEIRKNQENLQTSWNYKLVSKFSAKMENFFTTSQKLLKNSNWIFPVGRSFPWKPKFVSNIFWVIVSGNKFLLLVHYRPLQISWVIVTGNKNLLLICHRPLET